ncbi:SLATT domain-containing protein [Microbulbifer sp. SSSA008]|uniref:SLATT domain-containing protein n=1 Tax=Microbulbifer sp. SSSA008 TaxID=3243380 RepID=UPI004039A640
MDKKETLLIEFERIEMNAATCKFAHFKSSSSKQNLTLILGVPVVIINVFIGSTLIKSLGDYSGTIISVLSLLAATLAGVQTYLSYQKKSMLHIEVGNLYSDIERESRISKGKIKADVMSIEEGWVSVSTLESKYSEANKKAQECPISDSALSGARNKFHSLKKANKSSKRDAVTGAPS